MSYKSIPKEQHRIGDHNPLKILIYSFDWRNLYETNIGEIFEKFKRDGLNYNVNHIFSINWSVKSYYKKINNNVATVHLKAYLGKIRFFYDLANIFLTPFLLKKYKFIPDVVVAYDFPSVFLGLGAKFFWGSKIAVIITNIPTQLMRMRRFWRVLLLYQIVSEFFAKFFVDYAIAISTSTKEYLNNLGISDKKIRILTPNVITRDVRFIKATQAGFVREKYHISKEKKIILSVGRLEPEKNFEALIRAFNDLGDDSLVLVIVGQGRLLGNLEALVSSLRLNDLVIFAGLIGRDKIWNYYKDADVFMLLSRSEGLGLVFWEAMYMGVPVIGSRVGGILDTIGEREERGFLWEEGDGMEKLKNIFEKVFEREEVKDKIKKARDYVKNIIEKNYNINDYLDL